MPRRSPDLSLSDFEQERFLSAGSNLTVASIDADGFPHLVAVWYVVIDGDIHFASYRHSQKVLNLRRNPKVSCMLEAGDKYPEMRGLVIQGEAAIVDDIYFTARVRSLIGEKHGFNAHLSPEAATEADNKRVVVRVDALKRYSWDHSKRPTRS